MQPCEINIILEVNLAKGNHFMKEIVVMHNFISKIKKVTAK